MDLLGCLDSIRMGLKREGKKNFDFLPDKIMEARQRWVSCLVG